MIIMLCRNNVELSKRCLDTLLKQEGSPPILVIDNASEDTTHHWIRVEANAGRIWRMQTPAQRSVAHCWNIGLRWAFWCGEDGKEKQEALVVNNDTELRPDTYAMLRQAIAESGIGMATCVSIRSQEATQGEFKLSGPPYRPHPDFSCFMLTKWAWEDVGLFDEKYEIAHCEDNDYHVRMHRAGVPAVNIGLPFLHHGAQTVNRADERERKLICEAADRNRQRFFEKYGVRIGTDEYNTLFTEESFGSAAAAKHSAPSSPPLAPQSE